jgi:glucosamine-phosphate N-acetyltransferase
MNIKVLEITDNIVDYMICVHELNKHGEPLSNTEQIKHTLGVRPSNILTFIGVLEDKTIVATATVMIEKKLRYHRFCCHIEDVGVHPQYRNLGYGKQIVSYCIEMAKANNCYKIKLNCDPSLLGFYKKLGFDGDQLHLTYDNNVLG